MDPWSALLSQTSILIAVSFIISHSIVTQIASCLQISLYALRKHHFNYAHKYYPRRHYSVQSNVGNKCWVFSRNEPEVTKAFCFTHCQHRKLIFIIIAISGKSSSGVGRGSLSPKQQISVIVLLGFQHFLAKIQEILVSSDDLYCMIHVPMNVDFCSQTFIGLKFKC